MNVRNLVLVLGLSSLILGCRQNLNPSIPLSPIGAMGGTTRVPPPGTGSYSVPGGYYQGQASIPLNPSLNTTSHFASSEPVGSGVVNELDSLPAPTLPLRSDSSQRSSATIQPASYSNAGNELKPATSNEMRPALRGMQVVDLTQRENLQQVTPPVLTSIAPSSSLSPTSSAWESLPSTSPATQADAPSTTPSASLQWRRPEQ